MKPIFNPSLMCMNFLEIRHQIEVLNKRVDLYHFDIMDGHYVPNITLSPDLAKAIAPISDLPLDFHLMVTDPQMFIEPLQEGRGAPDGARHPELLQPACRGDQRQSLPDHRRDPEGRSPARRGH